MKQRLGDLSSTRKALRELPSSDDYFTEQCLARYLTVRSAGYLEAVRDDVADQFVANRAGVEVVSRVRAHLRIGQGVAPAQLTTFVGTFMSQWAADLEDVLSANDSHLKMSLGSLVKARKSIAHGDGETVTTGKAIAWSETAEQIGRWLIKRFDPSTNASESIMMGSTRDD